MKEHRLLKDHTTKTYQYMGYLSNDNLLTDNVAEMLKVKMDVGW